MQLVYEMFTSKILELSADTREIVVVEISTEISIGYAGHVLQLVSISRGACGGERYVVADYTINITVKFCSYELNYGAVFVCEVIF